MKTIIYLSLMILFFSCKSEKNEKEFSNDFIEIDSIADNVDPIQYNAEFKYGTDSITKIIYCNMNLKKEFGTVFVSFKIDTIGNMYDIKIGKSDNKNLNGEALRLTKLIPNEWKPAELGGGKKRIKVLSKYYLPIRFEKMIKERNCK